MDYQGIRTFYYQKTISRILACAIIGVLVMMALTYYRPLLDLARSIQITGSPFQKARIDVSGFYALHGTWPKNSQEALDFGLHDRYDEINPNTGITNVQVVDGAIHFYVGDENSEGIITLRPALPTDDPFGPVIWVCGDDRASEGWQIQGRDRTRFDTKAIHPRLR